MAEFFKVSDVGKSGLQVKKTTGTPDVRGVTQIQLDSNLTLTPNGGGSVTVQSTGGGGSVSPANPSATIGATATNGVATTFMRSDAAPALETTGVAANTYGSATEVGQFTVDATGRITSASTITISGTASGANPSATIGATATNGVATTFMRSDAAPALETTGVSANTYGSATEVGQFTVDATGRITSASTVTITGTSSGANPSATIGATATNGVATTFMRSDAAPALETTGVSANTYGSATEVGQFTVDATGRITSASTVTITGTSSGANPSATIGATATNGVATTFMRSDAAPALETTGVAANTYGSATEVGQFTVDATGRITSASTVTITGFSGGANPSATIGATATNGVATTFMRSDAAPALETTGVAANTYGSATEVGQFTVDATGRITSASTVTITGTSSGANPSATIGATATNGVATTFMRSDAAPALETTGVTPNTYGDALLIPVLTVDATGRITAASTVSPSASGTMSSFDLTGDNAITDTISNGDTVDIAGGTAITTVGNGLASGSVTVNLDDTAVTPATYGSATQVGQFTVDQQGRITSATNVTIAGGGGSGVDVENSGVALGTATILNFSTNLAASLAGSTATITASGGGGSGNQPVYKAHDGSASPYWGDNIRLLQDRNAAGGDLDMVNLNGFSYFTPLYNNQTNVGAASGNMFQMSGDNNSIASGLRNTTGIVLDVGAEFVLGCGVDSDSKTYPVTIYDFDEYNSNVGAGTITKEAYWISNLNYTGLDNSTLGSLQPGVDIFTKAHVKTYDPADLSKFYVTNNGNITAVYAGEYTFPKGGQIVDLFLIKDFGYNFQSGESTLVTLQ